MKFLLFDAMGLVFRAYHAMSKMGLQSPNGELTGAVFGFGNILATILNKEKPDFVCIAFDTAAPTFRHEKYEQYKAHRPEFPAELVPQLQRIKEMVECLRLTQVELPGYEADDIIGTLAKQAAQLATDNGEPLEIYCVTSDKDYCQLVSDKIKLLRPGFSLGEYEIVDLKGVEAKFGVHPSQVVDVLALIGDASDNVPGVKGVGEKTAIPLIQKFGNLETLYENLHTIEKDSVRKKLETDREMAFLSKELVTLHTTVPLNLHLIDFQRQAPDTTKTRELFQMLGFRTMLGKFIQDPTSANTITTQEQQTTPKKTDDVLQTHPLRTLQDVPHEYILVDTPEQLSSMAEELQTASLIAFDCETTSLNVMTCELVGISLSGSPGRAFYIPVYNAEPQTLTEQEIIPSEPQRSLFDAPPQPKVVSEPGQKQFWDLTKTTVQSLLGDPHVPKCGQNAKFDMVILRRFGINVYPLAFDTMLASYVLNSDKQHNMDALAQRWLQYRPIPISALIGEKKKEQLSMRDVEITKVAEYAAEDADVTLQLAERLTTELQKENLFDFATSVEFNVVPALAEMEFNGIKIDTAALGRISVLIKEQIIRLKQQIFSETAQYGIPEFNVDSPKQLGEILFEQMKIPPVKKTKTGFSTDSFVLEELAGDYPIARYVLEYRQLAKLQSTYVEALPKLVTPSTGRVHSTFNQAVVGTGRLSSTDPNLQNIPIRTELGLEIRRAFIADVERHPGSTLLSADYSQIELRIMAFMCGDETLIQAFQHGFDIHAATAATLFGIRVDEVGREQRRIAKTVNFGVMYGQGAFGLAQQLGISRTEGKEIIDNYFAKYPRIKEYIDTTIQKTRETGYACTLLGRRKYFPDIHSNNRGHRTAAERAAVNMPIQGTAAEMMKLAMACVYNRIKSEHLRSKMLLQIHDELVFEMMPEEQTILPEIVRTSMQSALPLGNIPVVVEIGTGKNWAEAH